MVSVTVTVFAFSWAGPVTVTVTKPFGADEGEPLTGICVDADADAAGADEATGEFGPAGIADGCREGADVRASCALASMRNGVVSCCAMALEIAGWL